MCISVTAFFRNPHPSDPGHSEEGGNWQPTANSRICSKHFIGNKKSDETDSPSYNPTIFPDVYRKSNASGIAERHERRKRRSRIRSDYADDVKAVPELNLSVSGDHQNSSDSETSQMDLSEPKHSCTPVGITSAEVGTMTEDEPPTFGPLAAFVTCCDGADASTYVSHKELKTVATDTQDLVRTEDSACGTPYKDPFFGGFKSVNEDERRLHALTAVSCQVFALLLSLLPDVARKTNELSLHDKLLLFLVKLRHGVPFSFLAVMFSVHRTTASRIFKTVLECLQGATRKWLFWPSRFAVQATMPPSIRLHYPSCRVIIDCTELRTEMPPTVEQQNTWYSHYKGSYTAKYLIGIAPNGLVTFLSSGFGGRAGDTAITVESELLPLLQQGDEVLADKGFPGIRTGLGDRNVTLVMPPFASSPQFTELEMEATYKTASVRIHVERVIQRLKVFDIINHRIPYELVQYLDKIMHVICVITNVRPGIFKDAEG
ncbi:uncharacterized protein LOC135387697 [Ornithodoros turicata]|uniref:uncharacterized protein LOC135387697 n=1 Tax=Ornithodoros turicata TaxID=34597 RepID=UPI0031390FBB